MTAPPKNRLQGFTLIELLVAMFLLAVLGTAGFQMLIQINSAQERIALQSDRFSDLQRTFYWLAEDVTQIIDRPVRSASDLQLPGLQINVTGDNLVEFTRAGWANPAADVLPPRSSMQRVAYGIDDDKLIRSYWYHLDTLEEAPVRRRQLLDNVNELTFRFMDGDGEWQEQWPPLDQDTSGLPAAIEFTFQLEDLGEVRRVFALPG